MVRLREFLNTKTGKLTAALFLIAAAVIVLLAARPWYENYMKQDHIETCDKARMKIVYAMQDAKKKAAADGKLPLTEEEALAVVNEELGSCYGVTISAFGEPISGICRGNGTWTIVYDEETGEVSTFCTAQDHEEDADWT